MPLLRRTFLTFFAVLAFAHAAERDIVRTFPAPAGCTLVIDTFRGAITVTESAGSEVRVAVHLDIGADDEREAEQLLSTFSLQISAAGPTITVLARDPRQTGPRMFWNEKKQIAPTYRVTVPVACNVDLKTRTGAIIVGNLTGALRAQTETGDVFFRRVSGTVQASTTTGDVVISRCLGSVSARTRLGTIRIGTVTGACDVNNASGDVELQAARGDLRVFVEAGTASIGLPRDFSGQAEVATSGGGIVASIDPAANCDIDATASLLAHVENVLPLHITSGRTGSRRLAGRLNRGGSPVALHASGGNVKIVPGDSPFEDTARP